MTNGTLPRLFMVLVALAPILPVSGQDDDSIPWVEKEVQSIKLVYEVFALPLDEAAALQREGLSDAEFYGRLLDGLKKDSVSQETFLTLRGQAGEPMDAKQGENYRFPSHYDPPELPNAVEGPGRRKLPDGTETTVFPSNPSNPTSFETRFLGKSVEAMAEVDDQGRIDLRITPKETVLLKKDVYGRGLAKVEYPRFAAPLINTRIIARSGKPFFLGTVSPPAEQQPEEGAKITHFAFVTATLLD